jgi:aryl-alcohol dehydrogenase
MSNDMSPNMNAMTCRCTAAVTDAAGAAFSLRALTLEAPRADEVRVRIVACGICHTDVAMRESTTRAPKPIVLGHEGDGIVEAVGADVTSVAAGDSVVLSFASCGACPSCSVDHPAYCVHGPALNFGGARLDGSTSLRDEDGKAVHSHFFGQSSFATLVVVNERNLVKVASDLPLHILAPLGCGIQTGAGAILNSLRVRGGSSVAVFGAGSVGLSAVMAARLAGAKTIVAIDVNPARLALALELGATSTIDARTENVAERLRELRPAGLDYALDTTGREESILTAIASLAVMGTCGLVAMPNGPIALDPRLLMAKGRSLIGVIEGDSVAATFIPQLIEHYRAGRFPIDRLITFYPFDSINDAMHDMEAGRVVKPVLRLGN